MRKRKRVCCKLFDFSFGGILNFHNFFLLIEIFVTTVLVITDGFIFVFVNCGFVLYKKFRLIDNFIGDLASRKASTFFIYTVGCKYEY